MKRPDSTGEDRTSSESRPEQGIEAEREKRRHLEGLLSQAIESLENQENAFDSLEEKLRNILTFIESLRR